MVRWWISGLMMLVMTLPLLLVGCGDNENFIDRDNPIIEVRPEQVTFSRIVLGESGEALIQIGNTGDAPLQITDMSIEGPSAADFSLEVSRDVPYSGQKYEIEANIEPRPFLIKYTPSGVGTAYAELHIATNDPAVNDGEGKGVKVIPLRSQEVGPQVQITPNPIVFGQVEGGDVSKVDVTVTNVGSAPLVVTNMRLRDTMNPDFRVENGDLNDIQPIPTEALAPNASYHFKLVYAPEVKGPDQNDLIVSYEFSGPSDIKEATALISANGADPCIRLTPNIIDFGQSTIGQISRQEVTVENCGSSNLTINTIGLSQDFDTERYGVEALPSPLPDEPLVLAKGSTRSLFVTFTPTDETPVEGALVILSDAPNNGEIIVPINGVGSYNQCPLAVAKARILNSGDPWDNVLVNAEPLNFLEVSAEDSSDPDGDQIVSYEWTLVEKPDGFSIGFEPSPFQETGRLELALIGHYVIELNIIDENGGSACEPARIEVDVKSDRELVVELIWRTPNDLDATDTGFGQGTDLDLHFVRAGGFWNDRFTGTDCHFRNCTQGRLDWGSPGVTDDNPSLDRDDVDGGGPELVTIRKPAATTGPGALYTTPYQVGAYYYDGHEVYGDVYATVRIFMSNAEEPIIWPTVTSGEPEALMETSDLGVEQNAGDFWLAGEIDWSETDGGSASEINTVTTGFP